MTDKKDLREISERKIIWEKNEGEREEIYKSEIEKEEMRKRYDKEE